jgi:acetyl-CoA synthetase
MTLEHLDRLKQVWVPNPADFDAAPLGRFAARHGLNDAESVHERAAQEPNWYWEAAAKDLGIRWFHPYEAVVDLGQGVELPRYFTGGSLNWSDYAIDRWVDAGRGSSLAVTWEGDGGEQRTLTYSELKDEVERAAGALISAGVQRGDTVGLVLPMVPEAVVAVYAIVRIGAIVVPMFSGYGAVAIRDRMEQSEARFLVTADAFPRRGRLIELKATVDEAIAGLPIDRVLVVARSGLVGAVSEPPDRWWHDELAKATPVVEALPMESDDPCLLLFTSGSTGRPKGCVHTHAGLPFKVAIEARHSMGLDESGTFLWLSDMGWVMGTYVVAAALANGATAALFEGTPDWPTPDRLWEVTDRLGVTVLGISPTAVRSLMSHDTSWVTKHDLKNLRAIGSTGEPWNVEPWMWCYRYVGKERTPIVNISGGTECGGALLSGSIHLGAKPMSFSGPALGMATDVVDADGRSVRGQVGELIVRSPWPGMTRSLWREPERYFESYWQRYPGLWHQSDFGYIDRDGYWYLLGRSDDTMNIAGKRIGPSEVESALVRHDSVVEAAAISIPHNVKGEELLAFVVLREGVELKTLNETLVAHVRHDLGPAIVPRQIIQLAELPKTRSGKIMRRIIRAGYLKEPMGDLSSLENPGSIDALMTVCEKLVTPSNRPGEGSAIT